MKTHHAATLLCAAVLSTFGTLPALADDDSFYYGGLGIGQSHAKLDERGILDGATGGTGPTILTIDHKERDTAWKFFGGYQMNRNFALEAGYFNLGKFGFSSTTTPPGTFNGQIRVEGLNLDLVGVLPLSESWAATGRVGAAYAKTRADLTGTGAVIVARPTPRSTEVNVKAGIGLQYAFSRNFMVRADAERFRINDAVGHHGDVNLLSISLVFPFGRKAKPAPRMAEAPAYVAPTPAPAPYVAPAPAPVPAPVAVVAPAPSPRQRVSFSAESLFGFDKSVVRPEGRTALDTFATETAGTSYDVITVEGHTDRLGTTAYNQKLSEERAEAVKSYLLSTGKFDAAKLKSVGMSETQPVTKPDDCVGKAQTAKLIACLQPDRRVEIEVTGTR
jgi:OOP family OmpA-OmpF porin